MARGITRPITFALERWIQKGIAHQLLLMTGMVALVAVLGGLIAFVTTPKFPNVAEAIWWAFLRLTDPGYLGDDEGAVLRVISTAVTVAGYVLFMGSLIAIMTQWLARTLRRLESGLTPITMKGHVVILGWTNRTPEIVAKLLGGQGRLQRFLEARNTDKLRVVVLAAEVDSERRLVMREHLGPLWSDNKVFLRSGSSLQDDHLQRLDLCRAAVVLIPGSDFELGGAELTDARVVKTLLTMRNMFRHRPVAQRPHVIAEILDSQKFGLARGTLNGQRIDIVTSDRVISRLVSQSVRHPGLSQILFGVLSHRQGDSLYLRELPELVGHSPRALTAVFPRAVVLGLVRREGDELRTDLDPESTETLRTGDSLVLLASCYADCQAQGPISTSPIPRSNTPRVRSAADLKTKRVLVLGWSHRVTGLISEFEASGDEKFDVTILSRADLEEREAALPAVGFAADRIRIHSIRADYAVESELLQVDPASFDHVLLMASGWMDSAEEADARTVLGYALLHGMFAGVTDPPEVVVELLDPGNAHLFGGDEIGVVLVSPRVLSHVLAHIALRPELAAVFDELFGSGGTEFDLRAAAEFDLVGREMHFPAIQAAASERGLTALGLVTNAGGVRLVTLNPDRATSWQIGDQDEVVVLARVGAKK